MFRKLLFFILLAGIGFGIYTGINKAMDAFHTPKQSVSGVNSGNILVKTGAVSGIGKEISPITGAQVKINKPGFFSRIRTNIKGWFVSDATETSGNIIIYTGIIISGTDLSGALILSGVSTSGDIIGGANTTGVDISEFEDLTSIQESGDIIKVVTPTTNTSGTLDTNKVIKKTTIKTPVTKTTTTKKTTPSNIDPILDALF